MPHVDEGQLHALLDGALPDDTAQHIRDHIAECAECRTRLHDEETVRTRAAQLLGIATPHAHVPPFETVLQRAPEAIREGSRFRIPGPARLAWAASIILALGIGWFGRDLGPFSAVPAREDAASSSAPAEGRDARIAETQAAPPPAAPQPEDARAHAPSAPKALVGTGGELSTAGRVEQNRVRAEADQAKPPTEQRAAQRFAAEQSERMRDTAAQRAGEAAGAKAVAVTPPLVA
ncbi:MAG TPA: zf-HC2 domain-containing protein, partial [Longimicrobiales bacterium]|nr:zf-HC2 domain-containing protein [Longimicrobiales bacterium]